jgi:molybdate transport system permease protein
MTGGTREPQAEPQERPRSDVPFYIGLVVIGGTYVLLLFGMLLADFSYLALTDLRVEDVLSPGWSSLGPLVRPLLPLIKAFSDPAIRYSIQLTLVSCTFTAFLSLIVAVPVGYALSRYRFRGRDFIDAVLDIPIVLPPLVVGLSLLILFQFPPFNWTAPWVVYKIPGVILAQFMVATAFAVRTMRATFDQIDTRLEQVALTLGCSRAQAFGMVVIPQATHGMITAGTLAWARALGEFGPLLVFAGTTRFKTEVLSTSVFLEISVGDMEAAVAVSMIMVIAAIFVLITTRVWGTRTLTI